MSSQNPKISWAQNRRSINVSFLIKNNNYGAPSFTFKNDNSTITLQCQGCLPSDNSFDTVRNFEITLHLFAPVFPISSNDQIKVTDKYIRISLFKKVRKSWEKLINVDAQKFDESDDKMISFYYGKNHKTAILYDWDLDAVLERQMTEALEEAGMLGEDFSTSGDDEDDDDGDDENSALLSNNTDTGFDGGESGNCSTATTGRVNSLLQNRKKNLVKKKTSRISKDPVYGDQKPDSSSSSSSSDSDEHQKKNNNKEDSSDQNNMMFGPQKPNAKEQQLQQQIAQQKKMQQVALRQMSELNKTLPVGHRRSLTDRQVLVLVVVIGTVCALVGGFLAGSAVYWKFGQNELMSVSPEVLEKVVLKKNQQRQEEKEKEKELVNELKR